MSSHVVALAGSPNAGKSVLFNLLTGSRQKVGNYPGVTVEKKVGEVVTNKGHSVQVVDLPGTYSLDPISPDEAIAVSVLTGKADIHEKPEIIVAVVDATNLERSLGLILDLQMLGKPVIAALNMMDLVQKRGAKINFYKLQQLLDTPVVSTIAIQKSGATALVDAIDEAIDKLDKTDVSKNVSTIDWANRGIQDIEDRYEKVDRILNEVLTPATRADVITERLDRVFLHPLWGTLALTTILMVIFQSVFAWAETPMEWVETSIGWLGETVAGFMGEGLITSLLVDGIIAGVGAVLVFLPQILFLFFFIFLLEASGYMMRAAYIMDRLMGYVGLQGRSFVPLLSSFACAIPGIMATRTIKSSRERMLTILVAPLMACSARLPVYVLLIGAFIPNETLWGPIGLQGTVMFGLFLVGIVSAMIVSLVFKYTVLKGPKAPKIMELPSYKLPRMKPLLMSLWERARIFLKRAGTTIMFVAIALWFLATFPKPPADWTEPAINYSYAGRIGQTIEPIVKPLGFDWRIATGLIPGFAAREVMVGALGTVFSIENADDEAEGTATLQEQITLVWGIPTGLALLAWYIFAPQCLATLVVAKRETNGWKWPAVMFGYMLGLAYLAAFVVYQVGTLLI